MSIGKRTLFAATVALLLAFGGITAISLTSVSSFDVCSARCP